MSLRQKARGRELSLGGHARVQFRTCQRGDAFERAPHQQCLLMGSPPCRWQWHTVYVSLIKGRSINTISSPLGPLLFHYSVVISFLLLTFVCFLTHYPSLVGWTVPVPYIYSFWTYSFLKTFITTPLHQSHGHTMNLVTQNSSTLNFSNYPSTFPIFCSMSKFSSVDCSIFFPSHYVQTSQEDFLPIMA